MFESLIPVSPDSVVELYEDFEPARFHKMYSQYLAFAQKVIDSLNAPLNASSRIDTLAIDHAIENFGSAARINKTIFISSSYFFLFNDLAVIRSVLTHEFGHIYLERLSADQRKDLAEAWKELRAHALLYLFRDGEYSGNAKFGGHPEESPEELFASAFNLLQNKSDEVEVRLRYVDSKHYPLIERVKALVAAAIRTAL